MLTKLADDLGAAIGSHYLKTHNQLAFVEYSVGSISTLDLFKPATMLSSGRTVLTDHWQFDCDAGILSAHNRASADIIWLHTDDIHRKIIVCHKARIINLGLVNFDYLTAASIQRLTFGDVPIYGHVVGENYLVDGDVFCVKTNSGNFCKIKVLEYGADLRIEWVTYKRGNPYKRIGKGYEMPEDIFVLSDDKTAFVTERTGNLLKVDLNHADRADANMITTGLTAPHQIQVDEARNQAYVVEYASPGRLLRIDLSTGDCATLYRGLDYGIGLLITSDLANAYVSEQGSTDSISRISLVTGVKTCVAKGLTNPFFMDWAEESGESAILIAERDNANRISLIDTIKTEDNVMHLQTTAFRPSGVSYVRPGVVAVTTNTEIDEVDFLADVTTTGLYKGIGLVPFNLIDLHGKANTASEPGYAFQFPNAPFGGLLPVMVDHRRAWDAGMRYYRVFVGPLGSLAAPRTDTWNDLTLNPLTGRFDILTPVAPQTLHHGEGYYSVHDPSIVFYNSELGCLLNSTTLENRNHNIIVKFYNADFESGEENSHKLLIDNNRCTAQINLPLVDGHRANNCGVLEYTDTGSDVSIPYTATHPNNEANFSFSVIRGKVDIGSSISNQPVPPYTPDFNMRVADMLGPCPIAAFAAHLYVAANIINGMGRQSQYDAADLMAFCLAPQS